jgi:hypothetical protein
MPTYDQLQPYITLLPLTQVLRLSCTSTLLPSCRSHLPPYRSRHAPYGLLSPNQRQRTPLHHFRPKRKQVKTTISLATAGGEEGGEEGSNGRFLREEGRSSVPSDGGCSDQERTKRFLGFPPSTTVSPIPVFALSCAHRPDPSSFLSSYKSSSSAYQPTFANFHPSTSPFQLVGLPDLAASADGPACTQKGAYFAFHSSKEDEDDLAASFAPQTTTHLSLLVSSRKSGGVRMGTSSPARAVNGPVLTVGLCACRSTCFVPPQRGTPDNRFQGL